MEEQEKEREREREKEGKVEEDEGVKDAGGVIKYLFTGSRLFF